MAPHPNFSYGTLWVVVACAYQAGDVAFGSIASFRALQVDVGYTPRIATGAQTSH